MRNLMRPLLSGKLLLWLIRNPLKLSKTGYWVRETPNARVFTCQNGFSTGFVRWTSQSSAAPLLVESLRLLCRTPSTMLARATHALRRQARRGLSAAAPKKLDRAARRAAREQTADPTTKDTGTTTKLWVTVGGTTAILSAGIYSLMADPETSEVAKAVQSTAVGEWLTANVGEIAGPFVNPCRDKLLPDWPPDYLNISSDVPCPHTLVLDLDDTLVTASWDRKFGWRHAKRPGVEQFLRDMAKYYEIVIFSSNIAGVGDPVVNALDREGCAMHRLYRECTMFVRGVHVKDLSKLNRPLSKIVVLDKDLKALQLQPGHCIVVPPYTNATNKSDTALEDITPFLAALVNENVKDVPLALTKFSSPNAADISREYAQMLESAKTKTEGVRSLGLGGFVRSAAPPQAPGRVTGSALAEAGLTARDIAGDAPDAKPARGRLFSFWERRTKQAEEDQKLKMAAWDKVLMKRQQQKRLAAER